MYTNYCIKFATTAVWCRYSCDDRAMTTRATASIAVAGKASSRAFDRTRRRASVSAVKVKWCEWPVKADR